MRTDVYTLKSTQRTSMRLQFNVVLIKPLEHQRSNDNVTRASAACDCTCDIMPLQTTSALCTICVYIYMLSWHADDLKHVYLLSSPAATNAVLEDIL
jgi:hypothetical protein